MQNDSVNYYPARAAVIGRGGGGPAGGGACWDNKIWCVTLRLQPETSLLQRNNNHNDTSFNHFSQYT